MPDTLAHFRFEYHPQYFTGRGAQLQTFLAPQRSLQTLELHGSSDVEISILQHINSSRLESLEFTNAQSNYGSDLSRFGSLHSRLSCLKYLRLAVWVDTTASNYAFPTSILSPLFGISTLNEVYLDVKGLQHPFLTSTDVRAMGEGWPRLRILHLVIQSSVSPRGGTPIQLLSEFPAELECLAHNFFFGAGVPKPRDVPSRKFASLRALDLSGHALKKAHVGPLAAFLAALCANSVSVTVDDFSRDVMGQNFAEVTQGNELVEALNRTIQNISDSRHQP